MEKGTYEKIGQVKGQDRSGRGGEVTGSLRRRLSLSTSSSFVRSSTSKLTITKRSTFSAGDQRKVNLICYSSVSGYCGHSHFRKKKIGPKLS